MPNITHYGVQQLRSSSYCFGVPAWRIMYVNSSEIKVVVALAAWPVRLPPLRYVVNQGMVRTECFCEPSSVGISVSVPQLVCIYILYSSSSYVYVHECACTNVCA